MATTGLLIEFNATTGVRAGNIDPSKHNLRGDRSWQDLSRDPALELRLLPDDMVPTQYEGIEGVTIPRGKQAINNAIQQYFRGKYERVDEAIMLEHIRQKGINLDQFVDKTKKQIDKELFELGVAGIKLRSSRTV